MSRRFVFLYSVLSGHFLSCLQALKRNHGAAIMLVHWGARSDTPFEINNLDWIDEVYVKEDLSKAKVHALIEAFRPDCIYLSGWFDKTYLNIAGRFKSKAVIVAGSDTQWKGTLRQHIARLVAPWYLKRVIDVMWVAGERQRQAAAYYGFRGEACWEGVLSCDRDQFAAHHGKSFGEREKAFLYVGRYAPEKGIETLANAYQEYRKRVQQPWSLKCAGAGSYSPDLWRHPSIEHIGFVQPEELPQLMGNCSALVIPSIYEPWAIVIHEAASAGLPVICTHVCGASVHLVYDGYNGFVVEPKDIEQLAQAMVRLTLLEEEQWTEMSQAGYQLSKIYSPERWARILTEILSRHAKDVKKKSAEPSPIYGMTRQNTPS